MKKRIYILLICLSTLSYKALAQTEDIRQTHFNINKNIAIQGYDPVSYFNGHPLKGKKEYKLKYKGIIYQFNNEQNMEMFRKDPSKYEPQYGGWCAYAMGESGEKVKIDPETYKIVNGRLYLFYNFLFNNTLTEWNKNERELMKNADKYWDETLN